MGAIVRVIVGATISAAAGVAQAQQIGQTQHGLALAQDVCAQCHAVTKGAARSPNANAPRFEAIAKTPGMTSAALHAALQTSHRTMPNLVLAGDDMANVIAYILSLKGDD
jgi:mono/diheme cytochrome c family protein